MHHREDIMEMLSKLHSIMVILRRLFSCCFKKDKARQGHKNKYDL